jgi:hypothetical protein
MSAERRREPRHRFRLPLTLVWRRRELVVESVDVSFRGILVQTDEKLPERQLVRLRVRLPDGAELAVMGMVVRAVAGCARGPGIAIQLYGLGTEERARWEHFVRGIRVSATRQPPPLAAHVANG